MAGISPDFSLTCRCCEGLPEPREDHAVVMCRFASECLERMVSRSGRRTYLCLILLRASPRSLVFFLYRISSRENWKSTSDPTQLVSPSRFADGHLNVPSLNRSVLDLELEMRAGLHSGAVTAGVLRGVRSRFQLFGDTMNTASR